MVNKNSNVNFNTILELVYSITKFNLVDVYENNPLYINLLLKFNEENLNKIGNNFPKLIWTLAYSALRTKEFNPIFHFVINELNNYLSNNVDNISTEDLKNILQSLSIVELMMKNNLTNVDFRETFSKELISSLLTIYVNRINQDHNNNFNQKLNQFSKFIIQHFGKEIITEKFVRINYTNLDISIVFNYRDLDVPLILVKNEDFNSDKKLIGELLIHYNHIKSYFNQPPMIINVEELKTREDLDKIFIQYRNGPKNVYKNNLE